MESYIYTEDHAMAALKEWLEESKRTNQRYCAQFAERFAADPANALEWSKETFGYAARLKVVAIVEHYLSVFAAEDMYSAKTPKRQLEIIGQEFKAEVMRGARFPDHSSSPTSNYFSLCLNAARAEFLERLETYWLSRIGTEGKRYV
jgi:hypothetical protein